MIRPLAIIIWAIRLSQPTMPDAQVAAYAKVVRAEASKRHFDPFTMVSIVHHESGWRASAVSADGEDFGLGQIRARFIGACRKDTDPVKHPSKVCQAVKARLLGGAANLRIVGSTITKWRTYCRTRTKQPALFHRWMAGYAGLSRPKQGILCGMKRTSKGWVDMPRHKGVRDIMAYRLKLIARLRKKRR